MHVPSRASLLHDHGLRTGSSESAFVDVLSTVVDALDGIPFGAIGGVASAAYGRPRWTKEIDVFCGAEDARRVAVPAGGRTVGVAGVKGFGGGFPGPA